jgi:hypothetical protein
MATPVLITRTALELYAPTKVTPPGRVYKKDAEDWVKSARIAIGCALADGLCTEAEAVQAKSQLDLWLNMDQRVQFPL